jgi:DNA-binding PadR family transcriptional regulator
MIPEDGRVTLPEVANYSDATVRVSLVLISKWMRDPLTEVGAHEIVIDGNPSRDTKLALRMMVNKGWIIERTEAESWASPARSFYLLTDTGRYRLPEVWIFARHHVRFANLVSQHTPPPDLLAAAHRARAAVQSTLDVMVQAAADARHVTPDRTVEAITRHIERAFHRYPDGAAREQMTRLLAAAVHRLAEQ